MTGRGCWIAVSEAEATDILSAKADPDADILSDEEARWGVLQDTVELLFDSEFYCYADKAWEGIHCCLSGGDPDWEAGTYPLKLCVSGGQSLSGDGGELSYYVTPSQVQDVVKALETIDETWMREQYRKLENNPDYGSPGGYGEEDFQYTWAYFQDMLGLFQRAATANRSVIFECSL